jgi:hypothetical protein
MLKSKRIVKGLYEITDTKGRLWIVEHCTKEQGFDFDEWHVGTEDDPHSDQYSTKWECLEAIENFEG